MKMDLNGSAEPDKIESDFDGVKICKDRLQANKYKSDSDVFSEAESMNCYQLINGRCDEGFDG